MLRDLIGGGLWPYMTDGLSRQGKISEDNIGGDSYWPDLTGGLSRGWSLEKVLL